MISNDREKFVWAQIVAVEKITGGIKQCLFGCEEFTMCHLQAKVSPKHLNRIEPRTIRGQIEHNDAPGSRFYHVLDILFAMGIGIIPYDKDGPSPMTLQQS